MGQIRKRGRIWWIRYYRNGQLIEESTGFDRYDKARDLLKTREGEIAKGAHITPGGDQSRAGDRTPVVPARGRGREVSTAACRRSRCCRNATCGRDSSMTSSHRAVLAARSSAASTKARPAASRCAAGRECCEMAGATEKKGTEKDGGFESQCVR
jgi:hypothetical protein